MFDGLVRRAFFLALPLILGFARHADCAIVEDWPCWRGPRLDGTSGERDVPLYWSATSHVVWKAALPGVGHASPIVYGDSVFVVSAEIEKQERMLLRVES